jgi:hypothetical protein
MFDRCHFVQHRCPAPWYVGSGFSRNIYVRL